MSDRVRAWLRRCSVTGALLALAACGRSPGVAPLPDAAAAALARKPHVYQRGTLPIEWTQFNAPAGFVASGAVAVGPDKNMWFGNAKGGLLRVTMAGAMTLFPLRYVCVKTTLCPFVPSDGIAVGSDGKFYLGGPDSAPDGKGVVGVVTTTGKLTVYEIPSSDGDRIEDNGLVLGPDGKVWFGEEYHIGNIAPDGKVTEYAYGPGVTVTNSTGLTAGPDGNVWFASDAAIGKVSPKTGKITTYPVGSANGIVAASDGNLYLFSVGGGIEGLTTSGAALFAGDDPIGGSDLAAGIIRGPDGNPWFSSGDYGPFISEFDPVNDSFTDYIPPYTSGKIFGIALGPDGNVWGADALNNKINVYIVRTLVPTPRALSLAAVGSKATVTVAEPGTAKWSATSTVPAICRVAQASPADAFTVMAAGAGTTTLTFADAVGNSATVSCTVR